MADSLQVSKIELHNIMGCITGGVVFSLLVMGFNIEKIGYRNAFYLLFLTLCTGALVSLKSTNIVQLFFGEFLQGVGIGAAYPLIIGLVDIFEKNKADTFLSYLGSIPTFIFFLAPLIGVQFYPKWQYVFYVILVIGFLMLIISYFIPQHAASSTASSLSITQRVSILIKTKSYLIYVSIRSLMYIGFYVYLAWIPFILMKDFELTHHQFTYTMIFPTLSLFVGGIFSGFFANHLKKGLMIGAVIFTIAGAILLILYYLQLNTVSTIVLSSSLYFFGFALMEPLVFFGIFSKIDDELSNTGAISSSIVANCAVTFAILIFSFVKYNDVLLLGLVFFVAAIVILVLLRRISWADAVERSKHSRL